MFVFFIVIKSATRSTHLTVNANYFFLHWKSFPQLDNFITVLYFGKVRASRAPWRIYWPHVQGDYIVQAAKKWCVDDNERWLSIALIVNCAISKSMTAFYPLTPPPPPLETCKQCKALLLIASGPAIASKLTGRCFATISLYRESNHLSNKKLKTQYTAV
jgi:hypothetical protein